MKMYENITTEQLMELMNLPNIKWVLKNDMSQDDPEYDWVLSSYSGVNALAGCTDYKDHRKDTLEDLKKLTMDSIKSRILQIGNYYNTDQEPFDTVILKGKYGGWDAHCAWSDGSNCFFIEERERSRERYRKMFKNRK